jgi:hypothetical protein
MFPTARRPGGQSDNAPALRRDFRSIQRLYSDSRSPDRLIAHYEIETALAQKLLHSKRETRIQAYRQVYSDLIHNVPDHPRHTRAQATKRTDLEKLIRIVSQFIVPGDRVLEIGAGDAELSRRICNSVASVWPALSRWTWMTRLSGARLHPRTCAICFRTACPCPYQMDQFQLLSRTSCWSTSIRTIPLRI